MSDPMYQSPRRNDQRGARREPGHPSGPLLRGQGSTTAVNLGYWYPDLVDRPPQAGGTHDGTVGSLDRNGRPGARRRAAGAGRVDVGGATVVLRRDRRVRAVQRPLRPRRGHVLSGARDHAGRRVAAAVLAGPRAVGGGAAVRVPRREPRGGPGGRGAVVGGAGRRGRARPRGGGVRAAAGGRRETSKEGGMRVFVAGAA